MIYRYFFYLLFLSTCSSFLSCKKSYQPPADALFTSLKSAQTGITFQNNLSDDSLMNLFNFRLFHDGAGVAIGDINNDGLPDIFFNSNQHANKLYLNKGNFKFEDISTKAGINPKSNWSTGASMADVNGDGWLDIYVCNAGNLSGKNRVNQLYLNNKNGTFTECAAKYNLADSGAYHIQAVFFDYDGDGDLDCYLLNNSNFPVDRLQDAGIRQIQDKVIGNKLLRNDNGHFTDVTTAAGIYGSKIGFGLGVSVADLNGDGWPDMYVSNDFFEKDYLYINQQNGTFKEKIDDEIEHTSMFSMGSDIADINNDGLPDIFNTDMLPEDDYRLKTVARFEDYDLYNTKLKGHFHRQFSHNTLQLNNGDNTFSEISQFAGVSATDWSWGALLFDFNNDGRKDIFVSNGTYKDITDQDYLDYLSNENTKKEVMAKGSFDVRKSIAQLPSTPIPNYGFLNQGNLKFKNSSQSLGLAEPSFSNGSAYADLDNDGDLDLVVNNTNMPCFVYRNNSSERKQARFLRIKFEGSGKNTFGIGAQVNASFTGQKLVSQQMLARGFMSSVDPVMVLGVNQAKTIDSLVITWPNRMQQVLFNVKTNQTLIVKQADAKRRFKPLIPQTKTLWDNVSANTTAKPVLHQENIFFDFDNERLIPKMLSTEGPKLAVADINGDGLDDFFIGSATGDTSKIYLQQPNGKFKLTKQPALAQDKASEAVGAEFFDANGDGKPDLAIASGGNQFPPGSFELAPRLYLNDGKGNFRATSGWIPFVSVNASCVRAADVDGDGDQDLVILGRSVPGKYGVSPRSYLMLNDGKGHFTDVTISKAPDLAQAGMITDAQWIDLDADGKKELVVVGDWMPVTIFKWTGHQLKKIQELPHSSGWWNCLTIADVNGDGKPDLLAGNLGLNAKFSADPEHPAKLYVNDFDHNGQVECIPAYYKSDGKAYPFYLRGDMVAQMPILKKKFLKYSDYAGKTMDEVFDAQDLKNAAVKTVEQAQTCVFINLGKANFKMQPLPGRAQISPVFGILMTDLNHDGINDLFLGGNFYGVKPEVGRYDASYGVTLIGQKKGGYQYLPPAQSGLFVHGEVRDVKMIRTKSKPLIAIARNNDALQFFQSEK